MKFFVLFFAFSLSAQQERPLYANYFFMKGQNLSMTSDVLRQGSCAIGIDILACGATRRLTLATSGWLYKDYNMYSLVGRYLLDQDTKRNRWAIQVNYFKTFNNPKISGSEFSHVGNYQMESIWLILVRTLTFARHYRMHINLHANYYKDEKVPFSLRRPYMNKTPYQFNLTTLHEIDLVDGWFVLFEMGLLDFARDPLHIHGGSSIGKVWRKFSFHIGASLTSSINALDKPADRIDYQQRLRRTPDGYNQQLDSTSVRNDYAIHPEFSMQYIF